MVPVEIQSLLSRVYQFRYRKRSNIHPKINGFENKVMATTQWRETKWKSQAQFQKTCQLPIYDSIIFYIWFESNESNPQAWRSQCCSGSLLRPKQLDWLNVPRKIFLRPSAANTVVIQMANITVNPRYRLRWNFLVSQKAEMTRQTSPSARFLLLHHLVPLVLGARTVKQKVMDQNLSFFGGYTSLYIHKSRILWGYFRVQQRIPLVSTHLSSRTQPSNKEPKQLSKTWFSGQTH